MDDISAAERQLEIASDRLQKLAGSNAPVGSRQGAETAYGNAFQRLVRLGARRQLRGKYRGNR